MLCKNFTNMVCVELSKIFHGERAEMANGKGIFREGGGTGEGTTGNKNDVVKKFRFATAVK